MDDDIEINTIFTKKQVQNGKIKRKIEENNNDDLKASKRQKILSRNNNVNIDDSSKKRFKSDSNQMVSKGAKFSSLFKNNAEIPVVSDTNAKYSIKENLFSTNTFSSLNLHPHLIDCIQKRFNLSKMTQIQEKTIPIILKGVDCFVKSQTGSGKTLAYAIPLVQSLQQKTPQITRKDGIYALVLVPTRELATQTESVFDKLLNSCVRIVAGALIGGIKKKAEKNRIRKGLNILIATPGRLCDHLDTTMALDLSKVEYLIFDEADRMLDMDFEKKINFIIFKLNEKRKELNSPRPHTILISATLTSGVKEIARRLNVENAVNIDVSNDNNADATSNEQENERIAIPTGLKNYFIISPSKLRLIALISFILEKFVYKTSRSKENVKKMLVFASTNDSVEFHEIILKTFLNHKFNLYFDDEFGGGRRNSLEIFKLYGNLNQQERIKTLNEFCKAEMGILVCTDVAARGLDMPNIDWIIQYNTPGTCYDYIHRVGRTARVGQIGNALIFLEPCEIKYINELNNYGISLKEIKLNDIMNCLNHEVNYYPRQINADKLVIAKNAEECANSMQFYIEEYVEKNSNIQSLASKAYVSFLRSYSSYSIEWKKIFHLKNLHVGHVAKSFGLRQAPSEIIHKKDQNNKVKNVKNETNDENFNSDPEISDGEDAVVTEKSLKPFNKTKKTFDKSGFAGLLRNHKEIDEYSSGMAAIKKTPLNQPRSNKKLKLADRLKKPIKTIKHRDMSVFD